MKKILLLIAVIAFSGCSRPVDTPVTPAQPPTVESNPTPVDTTTK